jgi:hypothetical protein
VRCSSSEASTILTSYAQFLSTENILFRTKNPSSDIVIANFGSWITLTHWRHATCHTTLYCKAPRFRWKTVHVPPRLFWMWDFRDTEPKRVFHSNGLHLSQTRHLAPPQSKHLPTVTSFAAPTEHDLSGLRENFDPRCALAQRHQRGTGPVAVREP